MVLVVTKILTYYWNVCDVSHNRPTDHSFRSIARYRAATGGQKVDYLENDCEMMHGLTVIVTQMVTLNLADLLNY